MFFKLWVRAPRTSILSIHNSRINTDPPCLSGTARMKPVIMAQKKLIGYTVFCHLFETRRAVVSPD
ncbi:hypothetical protein AV903_20940 [Erwinia tracheiphila]|uniref:Uncharacterized protein n=1 Tax=Erwinia tracheiphila TaxID=65700 RepID=A0A345CWV9_9GAMM|nr:hypothetical protein AV903_20940 [Erwinia tracheiphila]